MAAMQHVRSHASRVDSDTSDPVKSLESTVFANPTVSADASTFINSSNASVFTKSTVSSALGSAFRAIGKSLSIGREDPQQELRHSTTEYFPMECISVQDFMKLERMVPRSQLQGQVVRPPPGATVHFISHQWLGDRHPDPQGAQLWRMQAVFTEALLGRARGLFSEDDWRAFSRGWSSGTGVAAQAVDELRRDGGGRLTAEAFRKDVLDGYVWLDLCSVPQLTDRGDSFKATEALKATLKDSMAAVNSIPYYVERSDYFWILAPRARHADSGAVCDLNTCRGRGWCRLEEWANLLCSRPKMPLVVSGEACDGPLVRTLGSIDYIISQVGRPDKAPCSGSFTCCRLGHTVELDDGTVAKIPCDKGQILPVLRRLHEAKLDYYLRSGQRMMYNLMNSIGLTLYAGSSMGDKNRLDSNETVDEFLSRICFQSLDDTDEAGATAMHWAMLVGHPNVVRKIAAARPDLIRKTTKVGFSPLMSGVLRPDGRLAEILRDQRFSSAVEINAATDKGITALDRAAKGGFAKHVALLLGLKADAEARRGDNGRTALLSAAEAGYSHCVEVLLRHRADPSAQGRAGETALHLAANPITLIGNDEPGGKPTAIKLLLAARADAAAVHGAGKTALQVARDSGYDACAAWLAGSKLSL